jgi:hypothetical protein
VTTTQGKLTGRRVTHYGITLPEATGAQGAYSICEVDGVSYYVFDFGGVFAGSRTARGEDWGGNVHHAERTAPASTMGLAASVGRGTIPCRVAHGEPEVFFND